MALTEGWWLFGDREKGGVVVWGVTTGSCLENSGGRWVSQVCQEGALLCAGVLQGAGLGSGSPSPPAYGRNRPFAPSRPPSPHA